MGDSVADLGYGKKGIIKEFPSDALPIKLLELGCLPGNSVELVQIAPFNDPIYINLNGNYIAIRRTLATKIPVGIVEDPPAP